MIVWEGGDLLETADRLRAHPEHFMSDPRHLNATNQLILHDEAIFHHQSNPTPNFNTSNRSTALLLYRSNFRLSPNTYQSSYAQSRH